MFGIPLLVIFIITVFISESWWARYAPHIFFIPLMAVFILLFNKRKLVNLCGCALIILCFFNSRIIWQQMFETKIPISNETRIYFENNYNKKMNIEINNTLNGVLFNLEDYKINYTIKKNAKYSKKIYGYKIGVEEK